MITLTEKLNLIYDLEKENFSEELIESIIESVENPQEPAYICTTPEELTAAIAEMSRGESV